MIQLSHATAAPHIATSPLVLSDRLLTLAEDADRAGFQATADRLVDLAHGVFDETRPAFRRARRQRAPGLGTVVS